MAQSLNQAAAAAAKSLQSCPTLWDPIDSKPTRLLHPWDSPGENSGVGCHFLLQCMQTCSVASVHLCVTPQTAARQASLSITSSQSLLKLMSIQSVMPSNHLILCHPLLLLPSIFPSIRVFSSDSFICIRWPSIGLSASASVFPINIQDWFPLGLPGLISLQSKGFSTRVFSNTTVQKHQFFSAQLSL